MNIPEKIDYWLELADEELNCFEDADKVRTIINNLNDIGLLSYYELPEQKGVVAYVISDDFRGRDCVSELFMYIKPEYRGDIRLFKKLINEMERAAKDNNCNSVKIGSNIGYNDDSVLKCLQRFGYKTDVVIKEIN